MTVRPLRVTELPALCRRLATLPLLRRYRYGAASLQRSLEAARARGESVLVCDDGRAACGLAWFVTHGTLGAGGYLRLFAVAGDAQGQGAGRALLAGFEKAVAARSRHAFLLVSDFNAEARRFYARHGYRQVGTLPGFVLPDVDELLYWKPLAGRARGQGRHVQRP